MSGIIKIKIWFIRLKETDYKINQYYYSNGKKNS